MKRYMLFTLCLVGALAVGYFAGSMHDHGRSPLETTQPRTETANTNGRWETFVQGLQSDDQMTAALSVYALRRLERGEIQPTKDFLASRIAYFYLSHGPADHPKKQIDDTGRALLQTIHDLSQTNAILRAALEKRAKDLSE